MKALKKFRSFVLLAVILVAGSAMTLFLDYQEKLEAQKKEEEEAKRDIREYTATSRGFGGDVNVTLRVEDGVIFEVVITHKNETAGMGGKEGIEDGTYANQIIAAQGGEIEGVARASFTTKAVKAAYKEAYEAMCADTQ